MRKIILILFILNIFYIILNTNNVFAVTSSPTPSISPNPSSASDENIVSELKDRIASRVAELKLVERRGIYGNVTDVSSTKISLIDIKGNIRFVDVDELTKFSSPSAKDPFGISDISKGSNVSIIGLFNKQSRRILARFVDAGNLPVTVHGIVVSKNTDEYTLKVISDEGKEITVDVENLTKAFSYTKNGGLIKSGFSKITEGLNVIAIGFPNVKTKDRITATRVISFLEIPKNPRIVIPENALSPQDAVTPSTGSGKKLTPIK